ncbi:unnamed protein product [Brassicogethes aeneus]|uniref:Peptidase C1A papain C-terminal domain-containing protein n=1 Tax=Brassicogethes aeneus TaxID=1431903 RepID=A0A9P0FF48_BRAAE|nr:unnamed protein product [Brassicogethes aeneus]
MYTIILIVLIISTTILNPTYANEKPLSASFIRSINLENPTWRAARNFHENTTIEELKRLASLMDISKDENFQLPYQPLTSLFRFSFSPPSEFDSRKQWPQCESIRSIRNQGKCGSCWAFGAVEAMSDRVCIQSRGKIKFTFSPQELVSCCSDCGYGCDGGYLLQAWRYWIINGIPSGDDGDEGCKPYLSGIDGITSECKLECQPGYGKTYKEDLRYGVRAYRIWGYEFFIKNEILSNGPVEAAFKVYEDFYTYASGVYAHTKGNLVGAHAVKIIGWGRENGVPYWLVANSWDYLWGENGFFKILRGENHCGIENSIIAGKVKL